MTRLRTAVGPRDHVRGPASALVTLVEYGDFQCPFCGQAFPVLRALEKRFANDLLFVFRQFPLTEVHPLALIAAEASEAAAAQGKFWEMHALLFENQPRFEPEMLLGYAQQLGLDVDAFASDLEGHRYQERVREDFTSGVRSGVNGTPCLFLNGDRFDGAVTGPILGGAIEAVRRRPHAEAR